MKILVIGLTDKQGGMESYIYNYFQTTHNKIHYDFIDQHRGLYNAKHYKANSSKIYKVTPYKENPIKYYSEIRDAIAKSNCDTVYYQALSLGNILPIIAAKRNNVKVIIHSHCSGTDKLIKRLIHYINRLFILRFVDCRCACSRKAGEWMFGENTTFDIIPNSVDVKRFHFNPQMREKMRNKLGLKGLTIGHNGRFQKEKNHEYLIDIFSEIYKSNKDARLVLIGDGPQKEVIARKIKQLGLDECVIMTGVVDNVEDYYSAIDVFLLPSKFEGMSIALIEAQMSGLPCICSENMDTNVAVSKNVIFLPITPKDIDKWVDATNNLKDARNILLEGADKYKIKNSSYEIINLFQSITMN